MHTERHDSTRRIRRVLSTRQGGRSRPPYDAFNLGDHVGDDQHSVDANRARLAAAAGLAPAQLVWMEQVHGRQVQVVTEAPGGPVEMTDAVVTNRPGLALNVLTADCVPVLLWDDEAQVIAAAHAGRQGVRLNLIEGAVSAMRDLGATPARIQALLGPAICGACYEVPADMQRDLEAHAPGSSATTTQGSSGLDLRAGVVGQLAAIGVDRVSIDQRCTATDPLLYSYRRDGQTGRQTAMIWIGE